MYSGDLVNLFSGQVVMQRGTTNSQIIFDKPLDKIKTNLSKLRVILAEGKHNPKKAIPLKYGQTVYFKHNALINNTNESRFIKYGQRLQSHQDGPLFRLFKIINKKDPKSQEHIKYGDEIVISQGDQTGAGDKTYLKLETDKSVSCETTLNEATLFTFQLERVFELYDRALCACPRETLYP